MVKTKKFKLAIAALATASAITMTAGVSSMFGLGGTTTADAASTYNICNGSTVFYTSSLRGAKVSQAKEVTEDSEKKIYTLFSVGYEQTVEYRQNLAYKWKLAEHKKEEEDDENSSTTTKKKSTMPEYEKDENGQFNLVEGKFSMELGFQNRSFKKYFVKFQSQQYTYTKDNITENYLAFIPSGDDIELYIVQSEDELPSTEEGADNTDKATPVCSFKVDDRVKISFGNYDAGDYEIKVAVNGEDKGSGTFKNVYESYASYVSTGDNAVTPLVFSADVDEGSGDVAEMVIYNMNGQSFEQKMNGSEYRITDDTPPVICFNSTPNYLEYGRSINFSYKVIDVVISSPYSTAYYYVLNGDQYDGDGYEGTFDPEQFDYTEKKTDDDKPATQAEGDETDELKKWENPFIKVTSGSSIRIIRDDQTFIPEKYLEDENFFGLVKVYYEISDLSSSSTNTNKEIVFVDWFANDDALEKVTIDGKSYNFLKLIDNKKGLTYAQATPEATDAVDGDGEDGKKDKVFVSYKEAVSAFEQAYQKKIDEAIANLKDKDGNVVGNLYAGSKNKFYLPSFDNLVAENGDPLNFNLTALDKFGNTSDYKYSIYVKTETGKPTHTGLAYNKLAIDLGTNGKYRFTILFRDSFSNDMTYPVLNTDGEVEWKKITADDVWKDEFSELLPFFEFDVKFKPASSEDPDDLSIAYEGTSYSGVSFEITDGVDGKYSKEYTLYMFDREKMEAETGVRLTPAVIRKNIALLLEDKYEHDGKVMLTRQYFKTIKAGSKVISSDPEIFKSINWNPESVTFTPQSVNDIYVVVLTIKNDQFNEEKDTKNYAVVTVSTQTTPLKGESDWLANNVTSVVLLVIAGLCLAGLIVLLVVKPKDKGDIDVIYDESVEKDSKKKSK